MIGREEGIVEGVENSSDSDSPSPSTEKQTKLDGETLPTTEIH